MPVGNENSNVKLYKEVKYTHADTDIEGSVRTKKVLSLFLKHRCSCPQVNGQLVAKNRTTVS